MAPFDLRMNHAYSYIPYCYSNSALLECQCSETFGMRILWGIWDKACVRVGVQLLVIQHLRANNCHYTRWRFLWTWLSFSFMVQSECYGCPKHFRSLRICYYAYRPSFIIYWYLIEWLNSPKLIRLIIIVEWFPLNLSIYELTKLWQIERILNYNVAFLKSLLMLGSYIIKLILKFIIVRDDELISGLIAWLALYTFVI